jgi:hypothetical protein
MAVMQQGGISMTIPVWKPARAEMLKRTAHFKNLKEVNNAASGRRIPFSVSASEELYSKRHR